MSKRRKKLDNHVRDGFLFGDVARVAPATVRPPLGRRALRDFIREAHGRPTMKEARDARRRKD